ncbi:MAG TPA: hypothetical protein PL037_09230, partial [Elusimicrobiales bacterium]|nr:hypothetical protein [Elusimicrobiales bacterium]
MKILPKIILSLLAISAVSAVITVQLSGRAVRRVLSEQTVAGASAHMRDAADASAQAVASGREEAILPFLQRLQFQTGAAYAQADDAICIGAAPSRDS